MTTKEKILLVVGAVILLLAIIFGCEWHAVAQDQSMSRIVGTVYTDINYNYMLDRHDQRLISSDQEDFKIVLKNAEVEERIGILSIKKEVEIVDVRDGKYQFIVSPGKYYISVYYPDTELYCCRYNTWYILGDNELIPTSGEIVLGPTILLTRDYGMG